MGMPDVADPWALETYKYALPHLSNFHKLDISNFLICLIGVIFQLWKLINLFSLLPPM